MSILKSLASGTALICGSVFAAGLASAAALIQTQPPCSVASGPCLTFGPTVGTAPPTVRRITFSAPSAGTAAVNFTGSMVCSAFGSANPSRAFDFVAGITAKAAEVPTVAKPGAIRIAGRLGAPGPDTIGLTTTVNMAATRVFPINAAGAKRFYLKLATSQLDTTIQCSIYDAAFTIIFIP